MLRKIKNATVIRAVMSSLLSVSLLVTSSPINAVEIIPTNQYESVSKTTLEQVEEDQIVVSTVIPITENNEVSDEVLEEVRLQEILEQKILEEIEKEKYVEYVNSIVCDPSDVSKISGLKEEDYTLLTKDTWWEGYEQTLIDLENNYGVSAFFAIAVSTLESGFGESDRAKSRNNYYGLELSTHWDGLYSNTQFWGSLIKESYIGCGRLSTSKIATKYCPPNSDYWASYTRNKMNDLYKELIIKLNTTEE